MTEPEIKELTGQLPPGDVLLIVPPTVKAENPSLTAHLLQSWCQYSGINAVVFYANLFFSRLIGFGLYHSITELNSINFIGERLFAASAFDIPPLGHNIHRLIDPDWIPDHLWQRKNPITNQKISEYFLAPIRNYLLTVDWKRVEKQAAQWTESTAKQIARGGYRIVGCTNTLGGLVPGIAILNHVKKANPDVITVIGGALCEGGMAEGILSLDTGIDYIFSGESDVTFPAFVKNVLNGKRPKEKIIYGQEFMNLDEIPTPDYWEYFQQVENIPLKPSNGSDIFIPYEASRGCWWKKCTFCSFYGKRHKYRTRSPDKIIRDLEQLVKQHPISSVIMADNLMPGQYCHTLAPRISKSFPSIRILYGADTKLTLEQMMELKRAGFQLFFGIESLAPSFLKRMHKNTTVQQNIRVLRYAHCVGMKILWNILYSIPGDQTYEYDEMLELLPLMRHLPPPDRIIPIEICRNGQYRAIPQKYGISNLRPAELYEDVLPSHSNLEKIAYYFSGDFPSVVYEGHSIITRLWNEFQLWTSAWKTDKTNTKKSQPPKLHLERKSKSPGHFVLVDTRGLPGRPEKMVVDRERANVLLVTRPWDDSPLLQWAVNTKLAVLRESWFIPLATTEIEILQDFEGQSFDGTK